jgi:hypothetical protein
LWHACTSWLLDLLPVSSKKSSVVFVYGDGCDLAGRSCIRLARGSIGAVLDLWVDFASANDG